MQGREIKGEIKGKIEIERGRERRYKEREKNE